MMTKRTSDNILLFAIMFIVLGGVFLVYGFAEPVVYEKETSATHEVVTSNAINESVEVEQTIVSTTLQAPTVSFPVNINTASADELMAVPGVGESRAYAIIDYREHIGGYSSVEQIMDIYGIGENVYYEIAGYLTV